jgi:DHA2 family lincomycin resistance protein-like MFS transporter
MTDVQQKPTLTPPSSPRTDRRALPWLVLAAAVVILNETTMVTALPRLMADFAVSPRTGQWLTTAFLLTMAVVIPTTGWFLQRVTTRRAFASAMCVFCAGSAACAVAPTFGLLVAGRVVQAAGTAVMMPLLMTTLMTVVPAHERGRVMGRVTLAMSVAPTLGPALSGAVLGLGSWRWTFALMVLVAGCVTTAALRRLCDVGQLRPTRIDVASVLLAALGFGPLVCGLSRLGSSQGPPPAALLLLGATSLAAFGHRQTRLQRVGVPLLDLRTLTHPGYRLGVILLATAFLTLIGSSILLPLYSQGVLGLTALQSGLLVTPGGLAMGLLGPRVGRLADTVGARRLVVPGSLLVLSALALLTRLGSTTPPWCLLAVHVLLMIGFAGIFTPVFSLTLGSLPPALYPHGSSLLATLQQVGAAIGTALVVSVLTWRSATLGTQGLSAAETRVGGLQAAFAVCALLAAVLAGLAQALPKRPARTDPEQDPS